MWLIFKTAINAQAPTSRVRAWESVSFAFQVPWCCWSVARINNYHIKMNWLGGDYQSYNLLHLMISLFFSCYTYMNWNSYNHWEQRGYSRVFQLKLALIMVFYWKLAYFLSVPINTPSLLHQDNHCNDFYHHILSLVTSFELYIQ